MSDFSLALVLWTTLLAWVGTGVLRLLYNVLLHPLAAYPGPLGARASTWWKTYIEVVKQESLVDVLFQLHEEYGAYIMLSSDHLLPMLMEL